MIEYWIECRSFRFPHWGSMNSWISFIEAFIINPDIHILSFIRIVRGIKEIMRFRNKNSKRFKVFYGAFFVEVWKPLSSNFIANLNPLFEWNKNRRNKIRISKENGTTFVVFPIVNVAFLRVIITNLSIVNTSNILNRTWRNYDENEIDYATTICKTRMFYYSCIFVWPQSYLNCLLAEKLMTKNFL